MRRIKESATNGYPISYIPECRSLEPTKINREIMIKRETRCFPSELKLREEKGSRTIEGYALVFGEKSVPLWDEGFAREVIAPDAISEDQLHKEDIKMTLFHNRERLIARSNKGRGTLTLGLDSRGLKFSFEAPDTADGNMALELVRRGDLSGCSFTYWSDPKHVTYTREQDEVIRLVNQIDRIFECTIGSDPAYQQTCVSAREVEEYFEQAEREAEAPAEDTDNVVTDDEVEEATGPAIMSENAQDEPSEAQNDPEKAPENQETDEDIEEREELWQEDYKTLTRIINTRY